MAKYRLVLAVPKSESVPLARSGHRCFTDGIFLYSYGGFNPNTVEKLFNQYIWCFHLTTKTWHSIVTESYSFQSSPRCVASSAMVFHKGVFFVFGGSGFPFGVSNSNETFTCNPVEQRWHRLSCHKIAPTKGYGQASVIGPDNHMYIFGGTKGLVYNNDLHKFHLETHTWEFIKCQNEKPPTARYRHEMVAIEGGFIVIGGCGTNGACSLDKLPVYNYANCSWTEVKCKDDDIHGFPEPRRAHSCVKYQENVYICGGFNETNQDVSRAFDDIWKLNVRTYSWLKIPQVLPYPTYFNSAAVTSEGCMYIFGGIEQLDKMSEERCNKVCKMWLVIPSLERLCWEALCDTLSPKQRLDTDMLAELGMPRHLLAGYEAQFKVGLDIV